jgi:hypothetical protein
MTERRRFSATDYAIGIAAVLVAFVVVFLSAGALNLQVPQWVLGAVSGALGVGVWFAIVGRMGKAK